MGDGRFIQNHPISQWEIGRFWPSVLPWFERFAQVYTEFQGGFYKFFEGSTRLKMFTQVQSEFQRVPEKI